MSGKGTEATAERRQREVDRNYEAFKKLLPSLRKSDPGRTALMRDGEVVMCFDTERDAIEAGRRFFEDRRFSIQKIGSRPVDLGYFSRFGAPPRSGSIVCNVAGRSVRAGDGAPTAELADVHEMEKDFRTLIAARSEEALEPLLRAPAPPPRAIRYGSAEAGRGAIRMHLRETHEAAGSG